MQWRRLGNGAGEQRQRGASSRGVLLGLAAGTALILGLMLHLLDAPTPAAELREQSAAPAGESAMMRLGEPPEATPEPTITQPTADAETLELPSGLSAASADLVLRLYDRRTEEPLSSEVELWPLALVGGGTGPVQPRRGEVPLDGLRLAGLTPGVYRVHVRARRRNADDPPEFLVQAPLTEVRLPVDLGRRLEAGIELYDESGRALPMANLASGWLGQPAVTDPFGLSGAAQPLDERTMEFGWRHASAYEGRFRLGTVFDLDCDRGGSPWWELTPTRRSPVRVELTGHELRSEIAPLSPPDGVLRLVGVALPEGFFDEAVRTPDGRRAVDHGAVIALTCRAQRRAEDAERPWLSVPIDVRVELQGHEPLAFRYTLAEGEPARRVLAPTPR